MSCSPGLPWNSSWQGWLSADLYCGSCSSLGGIQTPNHRQAQNLVLYSNGNVSSVLVSCHHLTKSPRGYQTSLQTTWKSTSVTLRTYIFNCFNRVIHLVLTTLYVKHITPGIWKVQRLFAFASKHLFRIIQAVSNQNGSVPLTYHFSIRFISS